jgi:Fuc2NAc and GlcNAc transferase
MVGGGALLLAALLTAVVRRVALSSGILDVPNERSSHRIATPRGGGAAVVVAFVVATIILWALGSVAGNVIVALTGGGLMVAAVGFIDDRKSVPSGARLAVHVLAAVWAVYFLGGLSPLRVNGALVNLGWFGHGIAVMGIVWTLNLFNFMDGIDGIAASEAVFVAAGGALLGWMTRGLTGDDSLSLAFAASCVGFLAWNWPPARIFMGDVGSGYIGYTLAVLALSANRDNPAAVWIWLILGGVFFVDATVTLIHRALRGEKVHVAHRSHAYQWLARRWKSHLKVTATVAVTNVLWLLPCAIFAASHPGGALWVVAVAFAPLLLLAWAAGAGRRE